MKLNKSKNGISLIVLVITIIVMIILATAIILSLNSSNISGKASEAKLTSDMANKKEAASVYLAEYQIKLAQGKIDADTTPADVYVKSELKKAGLDTSDIAITDEGDILLGTAAILINQDVPLGTEVKGYKLNNTTTYTTSGEENTTELFDGMDYGAEGPGISSTVTREKNPTWSYMGLDENGNVLIVGNVVSDSPTMMLGGFGAYLSGPKELDKACDTLYSSAMGTARNINWEDVKKVLKYEGPLGAYYVERNLITTSTPLLIGEIAKKLNFELEDRYGWNFLPNEKKIQEYYSEIDHIKKDSNSIKAVESVKNLICQPLSYWLASSFVTANFYWTADFNVRYVNNTAVTYAFMVDTDEGSVQDSYYLRPVVKLNTNVNVTYANGVITLS